MNSAMDPSSYDYVIAGGGLAGCTIASRLKQKLPSASILLIEAGEDQINHPLTGKPLAGVRLHHSELDWDLRTKAILIVNIRCGNQCEPLGKALAFLTILIPTAAIPSASLSGLKTTTKDAGSLPTESITSRVLILRQKLASPELLFLKTPNGAELEDGRRVFAEKEVILSCGVYHSPQIFLLSGIGPASELQKHSIVQLVDSPEVGRNFHDHLAVPVVWKLKSREHGLLMSTLLSNPAMGLGLPIDWMILDGLDSATIRRAIDGADESSKYLLDPQNAFTSRPVQPLPEWTFLWTERILRQWFLACSRPHEEESLASENPLDSPVVDPNYYATEIDRVVTRAGMKTALRVYTETEALKDILDCEVPPEGFQFVLIPLTRSWMPVFGAWGLPSSTQAAAVPWERLWTPNCELMALKAYE
ncbi:hypothetical protein N7532_011515 [Penicillium argentinense]|uniref:Glucose-methanol-choline oxidoreductase N-terminal domain-containing protein n=1 Tax=Penicillium argentinense TaxID=1131581 RepID=A0A9W9JVB0_9EURO|nr:uncharacterized protein N7532_011515 [Penicillium argentinense]KAJ5082472.1 hypothetical protein N7532_011515 [Penicillium argentinense]